MGFSVTASQAVLLVAAFAAGSVLTGAVLGAVGAVDGGYREAWRDREAEVHSNLTLVDDATWPAYEAGPQRLKVRAANDGSTVVEVSGLTWLIDGAYANDMIDQYDVGGDGTTDLVLPGETLEVWFNPIAASPAHVKVTTAQGTSAYWRA